MQRLGGNLPKKIYYGWWVVAAAFVTLFVCSGVGFFTLPVFLKSIAEDMGWGIGTVSNAGAIAALAAGLSAPLIGYIIDRYGPRVTMAPGVLLLSVSVLLLGRIQSPAQLYVLFAGVGIGMAGSTMLPSQTLVSRWFDKKRGRAMGIMAVAGGLAAAVWMPISNSLVAYLGWRNSYPVLGMIVAVVSLPLILIVVRSSPASMGLPMDGEDIGAEENDAGPLASTEVAGFSAREALGTRSFWLILCAVLFLTFASSGLSLHVINFFQEAGLSKNLATYTWSGTFLVGVGGRFFFGYISEKYQKRYFASTANIVRAFSVALLVLFSFKMLPAVVAIVQLAILYGLGNACNAVMNPLIVGETFGVKNFGKIMGMLGIPFTIGMASGQVFGGHLFDWQQSYTIAFSVFAVSFLISGTAIRFARPLFLLERDESPRHLIESLSDD